MNQNNPHTMEKENENEVTHIEITFQNREDLNDLAASKDFRGFIQEKSLEKIEYAIKNKLEKVELFNIFNLSLIVELDRPNYKPVLKRIIKNYEAIEDFESCNRIQKLIKAL